MVFVKKDERSWLNIIKLAYNSHLWESKSSFKEALFAVVLNKQEAEISGIKRRKESRTDTKGKDEIGKEKIRKTIAKYKPTMWFPEIIEAFFSKFEASSSGQFYTPETCCKLLADIALLYVNKEKPTVYDPACGCGSLLYALALKRKQAKIYGQELNRESITNARFFLEKWKYKLKEADTLYGDRIQNRFDIILCNPPFNMSLEKEVYRTKDGNTAWTRHCLEKTKYDGITVIILSSTIMNGEKFKECRKELINRNQLEAVVLLPNKIYANTYVETCFMVIRKKREKDEPIFLLDASTDQSAIENSARKSIIGEKILQDYINKKGTLITLNQAKANDYDLTLTIYKKDQREGTPIGELFNYLWSDSGKEILAQKSLEVKGSLFSNYVKKMAIVEKGELVNKKVLYFWSKDGDENKTEALRDYLLTNLAEVRTFYTGAIIKHIRKDAFLKYFKIDPKEFYEPKN